MLGEHICGAVKEAALWVTLPQDTIMKKVTELCSQGKGQCLLQGGSANSPPPYISEALFKKLNLEN